MKVKLENEKLSNEIDRKLVQKKKEKPKVELRAVDLPPGCETEMGRQMRLGKVKYKKEPLLQDRG